MKKTLIFLTTILLINCEGGIEKEQLAGKWTAVELTEEGDSLNVNLEEVTLGFEEKSYTFTSTLNYKEAGIYSIKDNLLMTQDSLNEAAAEKVVEITKLENDSLFIRMNEEGKERILVMKRK